MSDKLQKLVETVFNSDLVDELLVLKLEGELDSMVEDIIKLGGKSSLKDYEKKDLKDYLEVCRAIIAVLKYHSVKDYNNYSMILKDYDNLLKDDSEEQQVSLELEEAIYCAKLGLEIILHCNLAGIPTTDLPELIRERGEYLSQEPDTKDCL